MTALPDLKRTALHDRHVSLGAALTDFGGWSMPLKYSSELAEHHAVRRAAGLFDLSHMGEVWVTGPQAGAFLDYALVGRLSGVPVGKAKYSLICAEDGGIIDDLITYRRPAEEAGDRYLVVPNAGNAAAVADELKQRAAGFDVAVDDQSAETSLIAVQGPRSAEILHRLVPAGQRELVDQMPYYAAETADFSVDGEILSLLLARTGYTGEDGFEIYLPNADAGRLWSALLDAGSGSGLVPAGLACRDSLRLEAGMPLYGNELSRSVTPYDAGLGAVVALSKEGGFVGRAALAARKEAGSPRRLVGLRGRGRRAGRAHYPVLADGSVIGEVTSGQPSPTLGYPVALAYVDAAFAATGTEVEVDLRGRPEPFDVVPLPFYKRVR